MQNFKLTIEYDGTRFCGWQVQGKGERTVQNEIQKACKTIFKQRVVVIGSGRTDSGVHAKAQVASMMVKTKLEPDIIQNALNANLPADIAITKIVKAPKKFHAQFSAKSKTYRYTIYNGAARSVKERNYSARIYPKLNVKAMRQASKTLLGRHDFRSFQAADATRKEKNTIRTVKRLDIKRRGDYIIIEVEANGFLYKMVRSIVGTLINVGKGNIPKDSLKEILKKKDRKSAGDTAKASGLTLLEVKY